MEVHPSNFRLLCTVLLVMAYLLEGDCALGVGGHSQKPSILRKNRLHGSFLKNLKRSRINNSDVSSISSYETHSYTQVIDHFGYTPESYQTFPQRYFIDKSNWGGAQNNSPIFVWLGEEAEITNALDIGIMVDQAPNFKALVVYIEHRYYGTSMPFGGKEAAYANASTMGYFTSTQALADYATVIVELKKTLNAENCPVVVYGGSYGGMLAAWFRLKYPHITIGALASSAPILFLDGIAPADGAYRVATNVFRNVSDICYRRINESWDMMDKMDWVKLRNLFNVSRREDLYTCLEKMYLIAPQYDLEQVIVKEICNAINSLPEGTDTVNRILAGAHAAANNLFGVLCFYPGPFIPIRSGWDWQTCTEMVFPWSNLPGKTMFPYIPFNIDVYSNQCYLQYGVLPRQHWATTEFGGHDIKRVLKDFGSNIIFSNGLRDPWSSGGVLENISESIVAIVSEEGTHCQDIYKASASDDPVWLKEQRQKEIMVIQKWIDDHKN